jgi:hypothetical protein
MPSTGGTAQWERSGGGEPGAGHKPLIRLVYESLAAQMGSAYDQSWPPATPFAMETFAMAKAIAYDVHGANKRLANSFLPTKATAATGMLQRWERIFGKPPLPGDTEVVRRARIVAAWLAFVTTNAQQSIVDALSTALGPIYVGLFHLNAGNATIYVNGVSNTVATVPGGSPTGVTITGTPAGVYQLYFKITSTGGLGAGQFEWSTNAGGTFVQTGRTLTSSFVLGTTGLTASFPAGTYTNGDSYLTQASPLIPWASNLAYVGVQVTQTVPGYHNTDGSPNQAFYNAVGNVMTILDSALPAWTLFDWFVTATGTQSGFFLDQPDLDLEIFDV